MWTRSCLVSWPVGYRSTCRESWGRLRARARAGVALAQGKHQGWPPPGGRCSGSTSWARMAAAWLVAGAGGRRGRFRPAHRWPTAIQAWLTVARAGPAGGRAGRIGSAGGRRGGRVDCAPSGRWLSRTSSDGCRTASASECPSPGKWRTGALWPSQSVFAWPGEGASPRNRGRGLLLCGSVGTSEPLRWRVVRPQRSSEAVSIGSACSLCRGSDWFGGLGSAASRLRST